MIDLGEQDFGAVARPREIGGALRHPSFKAGIEVANLVARLRDLAGIAHDGDVTPPTTRTITMPPTIETQRSMAAFARCSLTPGRQPFVGGAG